MKASRLLVLPAALLVVTPLLASTASVAATTAPAFRQYHAPSAPKDVRGNPTKGDASGEPSLGFDTRTNDVMYMAEKATFRVNGFDLGKNEKATWTDVTDPVIGAQTSDPILYTDPVTLRTYANQLELQGGSLQAYTDDQGRTWTHSTMGGSIGIAFDHQSIVTGKPVAEGGKYPAPLIGPNYLYYCTNDIAQAACSVSLDGGLNFLVAVPVYTSASSTCSKIFGHLKTDPRLGYLYLPPDGCGNGQELWTSKDNSFSWTSSKLPGSTLGDSGHPSIAVGRQDGAIFYAYGSNDQGNGTGRVHVQVSGDKGRTWAAPAVLGADLGIVTSRFPVAVAGDKGRAAVGFLGAKVKGDSSAFPDPTAPNKKAYTGSWDLYVSFTADGGKTWKTYDATPGDPVQRGPVCTQGTTCLAGRNLLDFNDMVLDNTGRVVIAMADGALTKTDGYLADQAKATIVRQSGGPSLYTARATTKPGGTTQTPGGTTQPPGGTTATPGGKGSGLAATGLPAALPAMALLLLVLVGLARRRRA
jgi:hypothetical protein